MYKLWLCSNELFNDQWETPLKHPIFEPKHEKYLFIYEIWKMIYIQASLLKLEQGIPSSYVT